jgi:hypothetical protein
MTARVKQLVGTTLILLICAIPAGARSDTNATDLIGTSWRARASIAIRTTMRGESFRDRGKLPGVGSIEFSDDRFAIVDDAADDLVGTWAPDPDRPRRFSGVLDNGETQDLDDSLERLLSRQLKRDLGNRAVLEFTPLDAELKGRLSRNGRRLKLVVRLHYDAAVHFRGRRVRMRIASRLRLRGKPQAD